MRLGDDIDVSSVNWTDQARLIRRFAEGLSPGVRRNVEMDRVLACEAIARSRDLLLQIRTS